MIHLPTRSFPSVTAATPKAAALALSMLAAATVAAQQQFGLRQQFQQSPSHVLAVGDVDGDGDPDLLVAWGNNDRQDSALRLNDGRGRFTTPRSGSLPAVAPYISSIDLGDIDGDGDLDALIGRYVVGSNCGRGGVNTVWINDGLGTFSEDASAIPTRTDATHQARLVDVDGDGDLDALFINETDLGCQVGSNRLCLNDGRGRFVDVTSTHLPTARNGDSSVVALGDVDGDGDVDIIVDDDVFPRLLLNDGVGRFRDAGVISAVRGTSDLDLADVDGDGDLDLWLSGTSQLLLNDGAGIFVDGTAGRVPLVSSARWAAFGDVDRDGDLDLVLSNNWADDVLLINDGTGRFTDETTGRVGVRRSQVSILHDVDADGDLDWIDSGGVSRNLLRQLDAPAAPRIGQPYQLDLYACYGQGTPATAWPFIARTEAHVPLGAWGTLRLDPASMVALPATQIPVSGRATRSVAVPPDPGLVGLRFYFQALIAEQGGFTAMTNLVVADVER